MQRYGQLQAPESRRFTTGPEESSEIGRITDEYLQNTIATLQLSARAINSFFSVECRTLMREDEASTMRVTDDNDTSLWLNGTQPLVSIRNVRDDFNFQMILFSKYSILSTAEEKLQWIYSQPGAIEGQRNFS